MSLPSPHGAPPDPPWPDEPANRHDAADADDTFRVPFSIFDALAMVLWSIVAQVLVGAPAIALGLDPDVPFNLIVLTVLIQIATIAGVLGYLASRGALSWRLLGPVRPRFKHVAMGVGLGIAGLVIVLTVAEVTNQMFGPFEGPEQALLSVEPGGPAGAVLLVMATVALAPIVEETIFRGLLFQATRSKLGLTAGMVLSALVFAYIHLEVIGSPPAVVGLVALGLWLAGAFHRTGTLVVPIVTHGTYNGLVLAATLVIDVGAS